MGRSLRQLSLCRTLIAALAVVTAACSVLPTQETRVTGPESTAAPASATETLLAQSRAARDSGDFAGAAASIERALRIEPNDAALWLEYARLQLAAGDREQAATLAQKAASLAGNDTTLRDAAMRLQAQARQAAGP